MKFQNILFFLFLSNLLNAQVWQWSVVLDVPISSETNAQPQAFLWIPENCKKVKAVIFTQHNMIEEGILENLQFRKTLSELGIATVWVTPVFTLTFDFNKNDPILFENAMKKLADVSGYSELANVPIVPMGHSALASFPWNFAAWNPNRTLAAISIHGDSPLTNLTGSGKPNPDWGNRTIDGVPCLFIMGEYEWWEDRIKPGFNYVKKHPNSPITFLADAGHGHFDYSQILMDYIGFYLKKVVKYRLGKTLKPINPQKGWLIDRWYKDSISTIEPTKYLDFRGDKSTASFCIDREMCYYTEGYYAKARFKKSQIIGYFQDSLPVLPRSTAAIFNLNFKPLADGVSFNLKAFFADTSKVKPAKEFANTPLSIDRICGPVKKLNDTTFQVAFYRLGFNNVRRSHDIWLIAHNEGDAIYKSAVQQCNLKIPVANQKGKAQTIHFPKIPNIKIGQKQYVLNAVSDADLPIFYYVKEGAAEIVNNELHFTKIPPCSKMPMKVTIIAWQYGIQEKVQSATPVEQVFYIEK